MALIGGDITFNEGRIIAPGSNIALGGLLATGTITIGDNFNFSFPEGVERADVTFTNAAGIDVTAAGGGNINIDARNLELSAGESGASGLFAGIAPDSDSPEAQGGDIILNVTDTITVSQGSSIANQVAPTGVGNAGRINITTTDLSLTQGGNVGASTFGQGNAGAITIEASGTISVDGRDGLGSGIFSQVTDTAIGTSGGINITTTNLSLIQGGIVSAGTFGAGDAGAITINALGTISANGEDSDGLGSGIFSQVGDTGVGNSGGINITTTDLSLGDFWQRRYPFL